MFVRLVGLPRKVKIFLMVFCDVILLPFALWSAVALRYGSLQPDVSEYYWLFVVLPFFTIPIFRKVGLYTAVVRFMDDKIIYKILFGVTVSILLLTGVMFAGRVSTMPRSAILIYWVIAVAYIASSRFIARGVMRTLEVKDDGRKRVAIYGAGRAGLQTALALFSGPEFRPVAFFDDNPDLHGISVAGLRVHNPADLVNVMTEKHCNQLLLAMPSAPRSKRREIIQKFEGKHIVLKTLPGIGELVHGTVRVEDIREVGVEDLLGRDPVPPVDSLIYSCIKNKAVLVTGAGGSIGSELSRQILKYFPSRIILFEQNEYGLYKIEQELRKLFPHTEIIGILGNVLNQQHLESVLEKYTIETIYHAAAYKHVPLVESNIVAGVSNNVFGTWSAALAAINKGVSNFVLISTDKAVRPTNVMGASKRLAELCLQGLAQKEHHTRFCMVRFGNVLGSSGSVVPLFKEQIKNGGPVTITHPDITRYFMTIPEAAQLVLQAGAMGNGGDVFVLDMGEPVKILDLARKMIELSGLVVREQNSDDGDIAIEFVGLRPGEKLYEELLIGNNVSWTSHPRIMRAQETCLDIQLLTHQLDEIRQLCNVRDEEGVKFKLQSLVLEYNTASAEETPIHRH